LRVREESLLLQSWVHDMQQTSRGKFDRLPRTTARFTSARLDGYGLCCSLPTRPRAQASYPVLVHRHTLLLHASFRPRLATTPLRFANPSPPSGWIRDSHPQTVEHARHTMTVGAKPCGFRPPPGNRCAISTFPLPRRLLDCFLNSTPERSFPRPPAQASFRLILVLEKTDVKHFVDKILINHRWGVESPSLASKKNGMRHPAGSRPVLGEPSPSWRPAPTLQIQLLDTGCTFSGRDVLHRLHLAIS